MKTMNDKIAFLIDSCYHENDDRGFDNIFYQFTPDELNELLSLVVKECSNVCKTGAVSNIDYNTGRLHCSTDILNHFGVK